MTRFSPLTTSFLGYDSLFDAMERLLSTSAPSQGFPPLNIYKDGDSGYSLELAVAGYKKQDISVEHDAQRGLLTISGDTAPRLAEAEDAHVIRSRSTSRDVVEKDARSVIKQGIAARSFTRSFTLAEGFEVTDAKLEDGMLTISLHKPSSPEDAPLRIEVR